MSADPIGSDFHPGRPEPIYALPPKITGQLTAAMAKQYIADASGKRIEGSAYQPVPRRVYRVLFRLGGTDLE